MEYEKRQVLIRCGCRCGILIIDADTQFGVPDYGISFYKNKSHTDGNFFQKALDKCKALWYTLINKDYLLFEICLDQKAFNEFRQGVNEIGDSVDGEFEIKKATKENEEVKEKNLCYNCKYEDNDFDTIPCDTCVRRNSLYENVSVSNYVNKYTIISASGKPIECEQGTVYFSR